MKLKELLTVIDENEWIKIVLQDKTLHSGVLRNLLIEYYIFNFKVTDVCVIEDMLVIHVAEDNV